MGSLSTPPLMRDGKIYREYIGGQHSIAVHVIAAGSAMGMLPMPQNPQHACAIGARYLPLTTFATWPRISSESSRWPGSSMMCL